MMIKGDKKMTIKGDKKMTTKRVFEMFIFILSIFILFSCKAKTPYSYKNQELNEKYSDSSSVIEHKILIFGGKIDAKTINSSGDTIFSLSYPYIKSISIDNNKFNDDLNKINNFIPSIISSYDSEKNFKDTNEMRDTFFNDYIKNKNETKSEIPWTFDEKITIQSAIKDKIFFKVVTDSYLGGAHPTTYTNYFGYDLINGRKISLSDIINDKEKLNEIGEKYCRIAFKLGDEPLSELGYNFPDDKFQLNDNFYLTNDSIVFYFNPYEITAYANQQYTDIVIPLSEIGELLK